MSGTFPKEMATEAPEWPKCWGRCRPQNETFTKNHEDLPQDKPTASHNKASQPSTNPNVPTLCLHLRALSSGCSIYVYLLGVSSPASAPTTLGCQGTGSGRWPGLSFHGFKVSFILRLSMVLLLCFHAQRYHFSMENPIFRRLFPATFV